MPLRPHALPSREPDERSPCRLADLMVACLEQHERAGAQGVAAVLTAHPAEAPRLLCRLMLLGELGLLPEPECVAAPHPWQEPEDG